MVVMNPHRSLLGMGWSDALVTTVSPHLSPRHLIWHRVEAMVLTKLNRLIWILGYWASLSGMLLSWLEVPRSLVSWVIFSHHRLQLRVSQLEGKRQGDSEVWDFLPSSNSFRADIEGVCNSSLYPFNHPRLGASISVYFLWRGKATHLITPSFPHLSRSRDLSVRWHGTQYVLCHGRSWAAHSKTLIFCFPLQLSLSPPPQITWRPLPLRTPIPLPLDPLASGPACPHCCLLLHSPLFPVARAFFFFKKRSISHLCFYCTGKKTSNKQM